MHPLNVGVQRVLRALGLQRAQPKSGGTRSSIVVSTLWQTGLILFGSGSLFLLVSLMVVGRRFDAFDAEHYLQDLSRVASVIERDSQIFRGYVWDQAVWDESYRFIESPTREYILTNYSLDSLKNLNIDGVAIVNLAGEVLEAFEHSDGVAKPLSRPQLQSFLPSSADLQHYGPSTYLRWFGSRPVLVVSAPITDTFGLLASNGQLYMLRYLDGSYRQQIQEVTSVPFQIADPQGSNNPFTAEAGVDQQQEGWFAWQTLNSGVTITFGGPTRLAQERQATFWILMGNAALLITASLLGVYRVMQRKMLGRLTLFSTLADQVRDSDDPDIRWPVSGDDELDNLATSLNALRDTVQQRQTELNQIAFFDALTGLPNRRMLLDRLPRALAAGARTDSVGALMLLDLDNFKMLNDTHGHAEGDRLLVEVAQRLRYCVREIDTVARLGGDEFVVLLENLGKNRRRAAIHAERIARKILAILNQPFALAQGEHINTASIGITFFDETHTNADSLLKQADLAMYRSKAQGRNNLSVFDPELQEAVQQRVTLETDLAEAIRSQQMFLCFQAQVGDRNQLTGAEVLIRWRHPQRGLIPPSEFIPLAEETGLILPLGRWVLEKACDQLARWAEQPEMAHLSLSVNVSAKQLHNPDFVAEVMAALQQSGADPRKLKLEVTESLMLKDLDAVVEVMTQLTAVGVGFSLDDFGMGYSALTYLKHLPLDQLKIDKDFVRNVLTDPNDAAIAKMIITLSESLNLHVIAEGVEEEAQRAFLEMNRCLAYQGYLFTPPLPTEEFEEWARNYKGSHFLNPDPKGQ
ncbi:MAG: EAL domain-containing protein [Thermostichus sp. BF3_bins_97]